MSAPCARSLVSTWTRSRLRPSPSDAPSEPPGRRRVHSKAWREAAFHERVKIHDLVMEGIGLALRKRGYPALDDLKAGKKR